MPGDAKPSKRPLSQELLSALVADTVRVALQIVRDQQLPESVASAHTVWLVQKVLSTLAEKEGNHDTLLRIPEVRFATWASQVRETMRRQSRCKKQ
jgi:hypothetical protein